MKGRLVAFLLLVVGGLGYSGCTTVQPWERGYLADYAMLDDRDALQVNMNEHMYFSREASAGGRGVARAP